ncbi:Synerg-CTERM sorting domain-containing protein [Cloacibacillus evryensis]|uniref:Synerg-CTERM sorting domain-containing protein n=1 Tax=Cloacibacillus evryensis TaxID=508460 RepID=UPI00044A7406|nr:Synerg-CTERM sorting domain-containing protein [Cloacibacillus evryensis]EXG78103.1 Ig-like domain group 2 -containing protein [Cloacibacillus evryensis DSM 19522]MEA5034155.1 Synerg-CTERM sorting domain-containing protein [Cloacibacillus evryensis]
MKRSILIFAALCALLTAVVSTAAVSTGGVLVKQQDGTTRDISIPVQDDNDRWLHNVETASLYGAWDNVEMAIWGISSDNTLLNLIISGDFDFKKTDPNRGWFNAYGGKDCYNEPLDIKGDTKLVVTGDKNAKIDLDNGGISLFGGASLYASYGGDIQGSTLLVLQGESPTFTPDKDVDENINLYGGSAIGNDGIKIHTIHGDSSVMINAPWDLGDNDRDISFVIGGSDVQGRSKVVTKGKTYVLIDNKKASATNVRGGGRASDSSTCVIDGGSELLFKNGSIGNAYAGCYASQHAKAYTAKTYVEIRDISAPGDAMITGGGVSGSNYDLDDPTMVCINVVSGDTYILVEPSAGYTGKGVCRIFGGSNIRGAGATAEILGSTNIVISGDAALNVIKPQNPEKDWTHISAGGFRKNNKTISNDVKGDGNITFKNITNISKLMNNTALGGQGRERDDDMPGNLGFYDNSVVGTSRLIYDNVQGVTGARTFLFDEIIFKNGSNVTFNRSLSQLYSDDDRDKETVTLVVEKGSTLRISKDPTGDTGNPVLGNAKIDGTLIVDEGMTLVLNNSLEVGEGASVKGSVVVKKVEPVKPPVKPESEGVIPVKAQAVNTIEELPANVAVLVEKQPNGELVVTSSKFISAVLSSDISGTVDTDLIKSMPVIKSAVSADKTALISFKARLDEFSSKKFSDLVLCKIIPGKVLKFALQSVPEKIKSGEFTVTAADGKAVDLNGSPSAGTEYLINLAVADNSEYDLDPAKGAILDPAVLTVNKEKLTLSATELTLFVGESASLKASGYAAGAALSWQSGDKSVAAIEGSGAEVTVKALAAGTSDIAVSDGTATVTCKVTVKPGTSGGGSGGGCDAGIGVIALAALLPFAWRRKR